MPLLTLVLVVGVLWAAKAILMPLALGIILAFALTPLVRLFDRWRLPRSAGVALTMLLALGAVGGIGYVVFDQFADLSTRDHALHLIDAAQGRPSCAWATTLRCASSPAPSIA